MAQQGGRIDFQIGFKADKSGILDLKKSLQLIQKIKPANFDGTKEDLREVKSVAADVESALTKAFNPNINSINLKTFDNELKTSKRSIDDIYASFSKAGAQGQVAFSQMARSVLTTNQQLKLTHSLINLMGTTMVNTVKWGIASSVMNTFTSSVQSAFKYVESLEKSLTNIRIVTGDSQEKMLQFAASANRAAQELGRSTMDYSKAALTFYQQGLDEDAVLARTQAVLKAQNITGAGSEMADYMTSVWNGYKVANELALLYVDKLAAVADSSASDMSLLAIAMSKVASTASTLGVDADQLNAQLATVIATTRQAPEAVGTAFKTIYTRMNDIKAGTDDALISLGNYSGKMAELGFNVLDATGHLRDTGLVMLEIGSRWDTLTKEQQIYLATTMGGQRQVNQLIALFDNWTTYSELLNTSLESEGTLAQKNSVYLESLGAKMEQLGAAGERVKASLIDSESFGAVIDLLTTGTNLLGTFILSIGGGGTALLGLGGIATQVFSGVLTKLISAAVTNMQNLQYNEALYNLELAKTKELAQNQGFGIDEVELLVKRKSEIQLYYAIMSEGDKQAYNDILMRIGQILTENKLHLQAIALNKQYTDSILAFTNGTGTSLKQQLDYIKDISLTAQKELDKVKNVSNSKLAESTDDFDKRIQSLIKSFDSITGNMETSLNAPLHEAEKAVDDAILNMQLARSAYAEIFDDKGNIKESFKDQADSLKENYERAISEVQTKYQEFLNELKKENNLAFNIKIEQDSIQKNNEEIDKLNKGLDTIKEKALQEYKINGIVEFTGAILRATSAISSLQNIGKIIKDESLNSVLKAIKITSALGYGILGLASAYGQINKILPITETLQTFSNTLHATEIGLLGAETVETGLLTAAKTKLAAAQMAVNAAYAAHPFTVAAIAIAGVAAVIGTAIAAYDNFHMSTELAGLAIDKFNQKAEQTKNTVKQYNSDLSNLDSAKDEWEELSSRAGSYNTTINNLTEDEKARYFELSNLIAQYNDGAVVGYDEQGNAIIANNDALKETILLLKQKRQEEINDTYSGEDFEKAQEGRQTYAKDANKQGKKFTNIAEGSANDILNYLNSYGDDLDKELASVRDRLAAITAEGLLGILEHREELIKLFEKLMDKNIPDAYMSLSIIDTLKDYSDKYSEDMKGALQGFNEDVIGVLQVSTDGESSTFTKAKLAGLTNMRGIVSSYIDGMEKYNSDGSLKTPELIAKEVLEKIVTPLYNSLGQYGKSGESLYSELLKSITDDSALKDNDFANLSLKNLYIRKKIEDFIQSNIDAFKDLTPLAKDSIQQLFADLFNFDFDPNGADFINFDTGKVENVIDQKIQNLNARITEKMTLGLTLDDAAALELPTNEMIASLLPSDIDDKELDVVTEKIKALIDETGNWRLALALALQDSSALANLDTNIGTLELLSRQSSGLKLSNKLTQALSLGLDVLKSSYADLQDEVEILNTEWLQGTSLYEDALRKVKGALLETLVQSVAETEGEEARLLAQERANDSIINMTTSMEDLQQAWSALNTEGQQNALIKVAAGYLSCKNEIQAYTLALRGNDETAKISAANDLARATYAAEMGLQYGIEALRISELADEYAKMAATGLAEYAGLDQNAELAADAATRYIRLNDAIADLQKNYDSMTQLLNAFASDSQNIGDIIADNSDAYLTLKKDLSDIIDVSEDMIDQDWGDWIADNADLIKEAMEGSQLAIDALRESAALQIELDIGDSVNIDGLLSKLDESYDSIADWANNLPEGQITGNNLDFIQSLATALDEAGYTADQIEDVFSGLGVDVDLATPMANAGNEMIDVANQVGLQTQAGLMKSAVDVLTTSGTSTNEDTTEATLIDAQLEPQEGSVQMPVFAPTQSPWGTFYNVVGEESYAVRTYGVSIDTKPVEDTTVKETTATGIKVIGANKSAGGKVSHKNASGGNKKSSGGKGGKGKKGRGGKGKKGKSSTPKTPKTLKSVKDTQDRYHDVNIKLKDIDNELSKVNKEQSKLTGPELLKNLELQQKLLDKQVATYKEKLELEKQLRDLVRNRLAKLGVTFDPNGNIANYSNALSKALADYNAVIAKYNQMSAEDQLKNKNMLDNAKLKYETIKKDILRYDKIVSEEIPGLEKSVQEAIDKQTEINIEKFKIKVDLLLDLSEALREFNLFQNKVKKQLRDDDVLGQAKASFKNLSSYYKNGYDVIQSLTDQVRNTLTEINQIDSRGYSAVYGNNKAAALEDLKNYMKLLMSNLLDVEDIVNNIKNSIFDAIDKAQEAFDEQLKEYEQITDLIDHNKQVVLLLRGDDAYKELEKYYKLQLKNNNKELDFLRQQKDLWYSRMKELEARMKRLPKDSNEWKLANDRFNEYEKHWLDSLNSLNDKVEDAIENIIDKYTNAIDKAFDKLENKLTKNKGLENISEEWELINKQADMYLDQVNSMYEIDKLENAYRDAIKDNDGNLKAQKSLNNMMNEQLKFLRDKDKLTQYDVDRANALLQIEIKRLALLQQRQSKTKLRLRRDAQGNYTYQYTADEEASQQAQQELADAENSLYNMTKLAYKNNLDSYYDTVEDWQDKVKDVYKDTTLTVDLQQKKVAMLNEYYGDIINGLTQNNEDLKKYMMEDTFNEMAKMYDTNVDNFKAMTQAEKDIIMKDMVPYWKSGIQEMADVVAKSDGGFLPVTKNAFKELDNATKEYVNSLDDILAAAQVNFDAVANGVDNNIAKTENLLDTNDKLIDGYDKELDRVQAVINEVQNLVDTYKLAKDEALEATNAAYKFIQADSKKTKTEADKNNYYGSGSTGGSNGNSSSGSGNGTGSNGGSKTNNTSSASGSKTNSSNNLNMLFSGAGSKITNGTIFKVNDPEDQGILAGSAALLELKKKKNNNKFSVVDLKSGKISSYASGGYTGDWGNDGRLAILHLKELVLNKDDTLNILSAIQIVNHLDDILNSFKINTSEQTGLLNEFTRRSSEQGGIGQNIIINADFPAAKDHMLIEAAFDNLINRASQFAFKNRR